MGKRKKWCLLLLLLLVLLLELERVLVLEEWGVVALRGLSLLLMLLLLLLLLLQLLLLLLLLGSLLPLAREERAGDELEEEKEKEPLRPFLSLSDCCNGGLELEEWLEEGLTRALGEVEAEPGE